MQTPRIIPVNKRMKKKTKLLILPCQAAYSFIVTLTQCRTALELPVDPGSFASKSRSAWVIGRFCCPETCIMVHALQNPVETCTYLPTPNGANYDLLQLFHVEYLSSFINHQADEFFVNLVLNSEGSQLRWIMHNKHAYFGRVMMYPSTGWRDLCSHKFLDDDFRSQ